MGGLWRKLCEFASDPLPSDHFFIKVNELNRRLPMVETATVTLTLMERDDLVRAIALLEYINPDVTRSLPSLQQARSKLASAGRGPSITVGVHGGQVQWVLGNPFPVRVCDYDGNDCELPDIDERDQKCRIWFEPIDDNWQAAFWREVPKALSSAGDNAHPQGTPNTPRRGEPEAAA